MIDEKKLIETIKKWQKEAEPEEARVMGDIICLIEDQPPAYDADAVVRELEEKIRFYENQERRQMESRLGMAACHTNGVQQGIKFAIAIVERGGRNEKKG